MRLALRNVLFTLIVPGAGAVYAPWLILTRSGGSPRPVAWPAVMLIIGGMLLYIACQWAFATVGRGTPGPWDAPRRFVAVGPYRWVRNPIYVAALLVLLAGVLLHRPLARVPENAMKFCVGLMLFTFGTFWAGEGVGIEWRLGDATLLVLLGIYALASWALVQMLRRRTVMVPGKDPA